MIKAAVFLGDSRKRIRDFPEEAKAVAGRELYRVQCGLDPSDWKAMNTVGVGVREIRVQEAGQFRVIYVAKFAEAIYVLHAFQKKTPQTPKRDIDLARRRFNALARERTSKMKMQKFENVFDALYDGEEALEMKRRAELAAFLERFIERRKLSQPEAAKRLGVSQPRVNDLLRGRLHRFSVDALLVMMDRAEIQIEFKVKFPKAA